MQYMDYNSNMKKIFLHIQKLFIPLTKDYLNQVYNY